jgi:hypothetical protein
MAHVIKAIKPSKLKINNLRLHLLTVMHKVEREMLKDFRATTATWVEHDPKFESLVAMAPNGPEVLVWTDDKIYKYVNDGTDPHVITPIAPNTALKFKWDGYGSYKAKTTPKVIGSVKSSVPQTTQHFAGVMHPGTEARKFDETIEAKWKPKFKDMCNQALKDFGKESGHGVK